MSYIQRVLGTGIENLDIYTFLINEGFKPDTNPFGLGKCMLYVASGKYTVWFCVHDDFIYLEAEYNCGGSVADTRYDFDPDDMESFMKAYYEAVQWTKEMIE